jgi:hypothetical protein
MTAETIDHVRQAYQRSPNKSTLRASRELNVPQPSVWKIRRQRLALRRYQQQVFQHVTANDRVARFEFWGNVMDRIAEDETFLSKICFNDEATFHLCGKVSRHNVRIWRSENPHAVVERVRDSPKIHVFVL